MKVVMENSAVKGYHKVHVRLCKDSEMLILVTATLLNTRVILKFP